jgi:hypothetical protein
MFTAAVVAQHARTLYIQEEPGSILMPMLDSLMLGKPAAYKIKKMQSFGYLKCNHLSIFAILLTDILANTPKSKRLI